MTVIVRRIAPGHHLGLWKQQPGWFVLDLWKLRLEMIVP